MNLLSLKNIKKTFRSSENQELIVLENVSLDLQENEIIAIIGKSGSGKSTLLRIIAGLIDPTFGSVLYQNKTINKPINGIAMVFQSAALMPWLTVLQNVELGLEALGVPRKIRRQKALKAIDTVGLDGFESAYPKELSGGMCQRVGLARAIVIEPEILLMDEPFSALDVLTAENLRQDLLDLWLNKRTQTKSILFVTHSIEEAALMADRIIIFASDPGHIRAQLNVNLPYPRNNKDPYFQKLVDDIYTLMTTTETEKIVPFTKPEFATKKIEIGHRLPDVDISEITGLLESLAEFKQTQAIDLPHLAQTTHLEAHTLFPITEALEILDFARVSKGDIQLTKEGLLFAKADILERKKLFAKQLEQHVPLAKHIRTTLDINLSHRESEDHFLSELEEYLSEGEAERVLKIAIDWGRYAEVFAYDYDTGMLSLENPK